MAEFTQADLDQNLEIAATKRRLERVEQHIESFEAQIEKLTAQVQTLTVQFAPFKMIEGVLADIRKAVELLREKNII